MKAALLTFLLVAVGSAAIGVAPIPAAAAQEARPTVVVLSDDTETRGDWLGTYGSYAYLLCGMRAPESLYGGPGYGQLNVKLSTGNPDDPARAWHSTMPAGHDRTILWEPNGLRRTPGSFDDHGEAYPLGQGPDLHVSLSVPDGAFLLSIYFFEIDWIQYRAYGIKVYGSSDDSKPVAETTVESFYRGKYKRFAVAGPCDLEVVIERGQSPNAIFSGLFLDKLAVPDPVLFDRTVEGAAGVPWNAPRLDEAVGEARSALDKLTRSTEPEAAKAAYLASERDVFEAARAIEQSDPAEYCRRTAGIWADVQGRLDDAAVALGDSDPPLDLRVLRYYADRAACDFAACRTAMREVAADLFAAATAPEAGWVWQARYMREYAMTLMDEGRRAEAAPLLDAYARYCIERDPAQEALAELTEVGHRALTANVPVPVAEALTAWEDRYGPLPMPERLLAGSLFYVAGRNEEAYRLLSAAEPEVYPETRHRWCLVAMVNALLRMDRPGDAAKVREHLETTYPGSAETDEVRYQFGAYYYRHRQLAEARRAFEDLRANAVVDAYKGLCDEYLLRVEHLEQIRRDKKDGTEP